MAMDFNAAQMVKNEQNRIKQEAITIAYAVVALLGRKEDDISENEAFKKYGKKWIQSRTESGMIHFNRIGNSKVSAKYYSVFEIETLKRAEKNIHDKIIVAEGIMNNNQKQTEK